MATPPPPARIMAAIMAAEKSITVREHWDGIHFIGTAMLECPDCHKLSPILYDIWDAVEWADDHYGECLGDDY